VRLLIWKTRLPTIAAGGLVDGVGIKSALALGAVAVQLSTVFILCPESAANAAYRAHLMSARAETTRLTSAISGRPARGRVNRLISHGEGEGSPRPPPYPRAYDLGKQLHTAAASTGNHEFAAHWAGQGAPLSRELPAAELVQMRIYEMGDEGVYG